MSNEAVLLKAMTLAIADHQPLPKMPQNLTLDQAYSLQQQLSAQRNGGAVAGLKAGLSGAAVQQHFGLREAVMGSLYNDGARVSGCTIEAVEGLVFECEIGVVVDATGQPEFLMPVVEIAYLQYSNSDDLSAANIIAANVGADRYICGQRRPWQQAFADTGICARQDTAIVLESSIGESLGGVLSGTAWMMQQAVQRGFATAAGMLLILGTCGAPVGVSQGRVSVDYGALGKIDFTVV
jgi:2-keto-4-pentenoate hydratase